MENLAALQALFHLHGWGVSTAVCMIVFSLIHWPCSTTCLTIWRETKSIKWTVVAVVLPTCLGVFLCIGINLLFCQL